MTKLAPHEKPLSTHLRADRLSHEERMEAIWNRQTPDRIPIWPFAVSFNALNVGYTINDSYTNPKKSIDSQRWTCEQYGWHPTMLFVGASASFPAFEFGGEIKWPTGEFDQAPTITRHPLKTEEDVSKLKVPDHLEKVGTIPMMLEAFAYMLRWQGLTLAPMCLGPMDTGGSVLGEETLFRWLIKRPELVHQAFRVFTDFQVAYAKLCADTFGTDRLVPIVGGPTHSNQIISLKHFREFCLPYIKEQHWKMREMGFKHFFFHPCGEQNANLPYWAECDMGEPGIISVGHEIELRTVSKYFPDHIVCGNLEPAILRVGTPEQVYEATRKLVLQGKEIPSGYIFSCGCEMAPNTPPYNAWVMTKAVNDFGWYE
jgi:uroporphyrinogen decarboxylase